MLMYPKNSAAVAAVVGPVCDVAHGSDAKSRKTEAHKQADNNKNHVINNVLSFLVPHNFTTSRATSAKGLPTLSSSSRTANPRSFDWIRDQFLSFMLVNITDDGSHRVTVHEAVEDPTCKLYIAMIVEGS